MRYQDTPFAEVRARGMLGWLAASAAVFGPLSWWIGRHAGFQDPDSLGFGAVFYGTLLAWVAWQVRRSGGRWDALLGPVRARSDWYATLWAVPLLAFALGFLWGEYYVHDAIRPGYVPDVLRPDPEDLLPRGPGYQALAMLEAVVLAPVVEELVFRGMLLHRWAAKWGLAAAALATSVAFGVLHAGVLDSTVFGLAMVLLYLRTGTLRVPIAAHALHNALVVVPDLLGPGAAPEQTMEAALASFRDLWWLGALGLAVSLPLLPLFFRRYGPALRGWLPLGAGPPRSRETRGSAGA